MHYKYYFPELYKTLGIVELEPLSEEIPYQRHCPTKVLARLHDFMNK